MVITTTRFGGFFIAFKQALMGFVSAEMRGTKEKLPLGLDECAG